MSDNIAVLDGYTHGYIATSIGYDMHVLVRPGTDLGTSFRAWDCDNQEFVVIHGYKWDFARTGD